MHHTSHARRPRPRFSHTPKLTPHADRWLPNWLKLPNAPCSRPRFNAHAWLDFHVTQQIRAHLKRRAAIVIKMRINPMIINILLD
jgi:hypothetical protein